MRWQFWQEPPSRKLSGRVRQTLQAEFSLDERQLDGLAMVGKKGRYSGRKIEYVRIFDPSRIDKVTRSQPKYDDFLETRDGRVALLFEGRIEVIEVIDGTERVFLAEKRIRPTTPT